MGIDAREEVWRSLRIRERTGAVSSALLRDVFHRCETASVSERSFIKRLLVGTIEQEIALDDRIREVLKNPGGKIKGSVRCLLRMSVYQLLFMDGVPDYACVNEALRLLKKEGLGSYAGFVNACLRSVIRRRDAQKKPETGKAPEIPVPAWIAELLAAERGGEEAAAILESLRAPRPVTIRFSESVSAPERAELEAKWREAGVIVSPGRLLDGARLLRKTGDIRSLPGFLQGAFTVQDESSQLVALAADLSGDERVLDLCAAPGGKTAHAADILRARGEGSVRACDVSRAKTDLIRANVRRLRLPNVEVRENDATVFRPEWEGRFDVVLCDVPCSGLGVMGKKRDIAARLSGEGMASLAELQKKIVENARRYVRQGGKLVYSTCTIHRAENEDMADLIAGLPGMRAIPLPPFLAGMAGAEENRIQLLPNVHGTDGFFLAVFARSGEDGEDRGTGGIV